MTAPITRRWRLRVILGVVLFAVLQTIFTMVDFEPDALRLALLVALAMALLGLVQDALGDAGPSWGVDARRSFAPEGLDRTTARQLSMLESHLTSRTPDGVLAHRLSTLADQVLRQRHGLGVRDPGARDLLGPELSRVLDEPARRLRRDEINRCITRIEGL